MGCFPARRAPLRSMVVGAAHSPGPPCGSLPSLATAERCSCSPWLYSIEGPMYGSFASLGSLLCYAGPSWYDGAS
eukprot:10594861-Prorocentrum_lima.AAC.1